MTTTTTELTEQYLQEHPSIRDCLKHGIINYSKLSRKIAIELKIEKQTSIDAILIACRRYETKLKQEQIHENQIIEIIKQSELEIKNKIVTIIIDKKTYAGSLLEIEKEIRRTADVFYAIEGAKVYTIITTEKHLDKLKKLLDKNIHKISKNLAMITIKSPEELEKTPGVISYYSSMFGEYGINIIETMSCWTDTIFVIDEDDIPTVINFFRF